MGLQSLFNRLSVRFAILMVLLIVLPAGIAIGVVGNRIKRDFRETALRQFAKQLDIKADRAETLLEVAKGDVEALVSEIMQDFKEIEGTGEFFVDGAITPAFFKSKLYREFVKDLKVMMLSSRFFLQSRLIDATGQEIIRYDRTDLGPILEPRGKLLNKSKRDYFRHMVDSDDNDVHVTSVSLNREDGGFTVPHTPMLRIGQKITLPDGKLFGVLVINAHAEMMFGSRLSGEGSRFLVIDEEGSYLRHWNEAVLFGKDLGHSANLLAEEPELKVNLQKQDARIHYDAELKEFRVWRKVFFKGHERSEYWVFMERRLESFILAPWYLAVERGTAGLAIILIAGFSVYALLAHKFLSPLQDLTAAIKNMEKGDLSGRVKIKSSTEVGDIADAYNSMAERLEQTDLELRRSMALESSISLTAPNAHIVADNNGVILTVNPATERMFGYSKDELVGRNVSLLAPSPHREDHDGYIENYKKSGVAKIIGKARELEAIRKTGKKFPIILHVSETIVDDERIFVGIIEDITVRKKAEGELLLTMEKLKKANEEIKSFANIVSHDLRSPLLNVKGFSGELKKACVEIEKILKESVHDVDQRKTVEELMRGDIQEALGFIESSTTSMERLISGILKLAQIGSRKLKYTEVNAKMLVDEKVKTMKHQIESRKLKVVVSGLPNVVADEVCMDQIFGNILSNAINYTDPNRPGLIEITGERRADDILFKIADNGIGIPGYAKKKVFEIFRRGVGKEYPGEGMGLAYVKALVEKHNGNIWFESQEGEGTTFYFTISDKLKS